MDFCKPTYKRENKCCPVSQRFPRIRLRLFVIISIHHIKHMLTKNEVDDKDLRL